MTERSPHHVVDRRGIGQLEKDLSRYVVNALENDYGLDFEVALTEEPSSDEDTDQQQLTGDHFYIQLKSSSGFDNDDSVHHDLKTSHISQYLAEPLPVVLAIYDDEYEEIYWRIVQEFVWDDLNEDTPNWREKQDNARIRVPRSQKITDYERLERAVKRTSNRITRQESRGLNIGDGIQFTPDDITELQNQTESERTSYRGHRLVEARLHLKRGRFEQAQEAVEEVSDSAHEDRAKISALLMQILMLNPGNADEAFQIAELGAEAEGIARDLDRDTDANIAAVHKHIGGLSVILKRREEMVAVDIVQDTDELSVPEYPFIRSLSERELLTHELQAATEINTILAELLENKEYYAYATCLSPIIDYVMRRTSLAIDSPHGDEPPNEVHPLVDQATQLADLLNEPETEFNLRKSVGLYHYFVMSDPDTATGFLTDARDLAKEFDDEVLIQDAEENLQRIEDNPDPHSHDNDSDQQSNDRDLKEQTKRMLEIQGIDVDETSRSVNDDQLDTRDIVADAARRGVEDADPEPYHRHCEHLHLSYHPSQLGKLTGVTSIGTKTLWCQHGGGMMGSNLESMFNTFEEQHCAGCEHHCPRPDDWEYTDEFAQNQVDDPDFQAYLKTQRESPTPGDMGDEQS
ncbi:DUF4365 domain-containing protein [Haloferax volcanii]|uniref:DUF4365 domain-containing protein n=1 Tax=Haloferax volcanii TaxID=2246 RepID=UPI003D303574